MTVSPWIQGWIILITFISLIINIIYWILTLIGGTTLLDISTWSTLLAIFTAINIWLVIFQISMLLKED